MLGSKVPLLTRAQASRLLEVSPRTVSRWNEEGLLPGVQVGHTTRYRREDVEALMQADSPVATDAQTETEEVERIPPLHDPAASPLTRYPGPKRDGPPYRICFASPCWHMGGLEVVTTLLLRHLDRAMWDPYILTGEVKDMEIPPNTTVVENYDCYEWDYPPPAAVFARARKAATAELRDIAPDVVIGQLAHAQLFAANDIGVPVVAEYHHCGWSWDAQEHPSDFIISVSEHTALRVHGNGRLPSVPAYLVYNGIDVDHFKPIELPLRANVRQYLGMALDDQVIGWSGRFALEKKPIEWVSAFASIKNGSSKNRPPMPNARGLMVGPLWQADMYEAARERAEKRGLTWATLMDPDEVEGFTGVRPENVDHTTADIVHIRAPYSEMPRMYAAMDCLMHTRPDEPFGLIVPEALLCGVRVVGVAGGGIPEIYDLLGLPPYIDLCEAADLTEMADTVVAHLNDGRVPPEYSAQVAEVFDSKRMTEHFEAIVLEYLGDRETITEAREGTR